MAQIFSNKLNETQFKSSKPKLSDLMKKKLEEKPLMTRINPPVFPSQPVVQRTATPVQPTPTVSNEPATYKGVVIQPGDQQSIQTQMRMIDNPTSSFPTAPVQTNTISSSPKKVERTPKVSEQKVQEKPTFGGILFDLIERATKDTKDLARARENLTKFQTATADKIAAIESDPIALEFQQGRSQAVQRASTAKEAALQTGVQNALEAQGQRLTALREAAGLTQPVQVPFSNQFISPVTGLPVGGGATTGSFNDAVSSIAERVASGSMGYDEGVDALKAYGQPAVNELLRQLGSDFDVLQSNALADARSATINQTGTIGGQLTKQAETVKEHIVTLKNLYDNLRAQYPIPLVNRGINAIEEQLGSGPLQAYNIALQNVRDELAKILGGGTSTEGSRATAKELLPDNMTPAQLQDSIAAATELMDSKIAEYTRIPDFNPLQQSPSAGGGLWDW